MLFLYIGTDRGKARAKMRRDALQKKHAIVRITDAHTIDDLRVALRGVGMFGETRTLLFENILEGEEMKEVFFDALKKGVVEDIFLYEEKPRVELRRVLEKYADRVEKFDLPKRERDTAIFELANALRRGDKKGLWVSYMGELQKGSAPEAIHGLLFWAVKDAYVKSGGKDARMRALITELAELPHTARRKGEDLEYALERFVLSGA